MSKDLVKKNALQSLAERLSVDPGDLKSTLKAAIFKPIKKKDGTYREASDSEFIAYIAVANAYKLNPLTKEIYAYPDTKTGAIIPVVSTDGWNRLMVSHPDYRNHYYVEPAETEWTTMPGAKPCPKWCEIHIVKKDGSETVVREYLDEVFRQLDYDSPWKTHTKRMLRHKTKIQGAREAFGFAGIYEQDEAERILEAETVEITSMKEPRALSEKKGKDEPPQDKPESAPAPAETRTEVAEQPSPDEGKPVAEQAQEVFQGQFICNDCTLPITKAEYDFSTGKYKKSLCRKCQKKQK
ncbi:MAG TPA: recombinase RecT [Candidatus Omnitrophota bacterium]|nr:recombinase RecT [Candidatus Omnitrophota bacterium]